MADAFDISELRDLERDLTELADLVPAEVPAVMQQVGARTKARWIELAARNPLGRQYTATIDYETRGVGAFGQGVLYVEIGPNLERYGGKTGKGGLVPSAGIFDDPLVTPMGARPDRSRREAEKFAAEDLIRGIEVAIERSLARTRFQSTLSGAVSGLLRGGIY
ncbi:hypothetical protein [Microbacterium sp. 77mftsu3.1]|uniref:hypothetical protein n=1 Tax=Microbacterium sp. 77mftsu3.1 TaxID=1761802 RepID=UPI00036A8D97|nr:hypothetical protein [Microbacterium sp. 77mftsu3.1]SDG21633.1 hypothetical protein SAMN04488590_0211 [Microbacterium sp. 77mftsu3.1]